MSRLPLAALLIATSAPLAQAATVDAFTVDRSIAIHDDDQANGNQTLGQAFSSFGDDLTVLADIFGGELPGATAGLGEVRSIAADLQFALDGALLGTSQFTVLGKGGALLSGIGIASTFAADSVSVLFRIDGGDLAATFGDHAMMTLTGFGFDASGGAAAFLDTAATDIAINPASLPAPVPLPAGLPLLLAGMGALALLRRRA